MPLTTDQMQKIVVEETLGKPATVKGDEADVFRARTRVDIEWIRSRGGVVDIPPEWPDADE